MNSIDLTPLLKSSIGFDRMASLLNAAQASESTHSPYPPYNIEVLDENQYAITLAIAGFERSELDITVERNVLMVRGEKAKQGERKYLHQGIAYRTFERKFNLADYVEVTGAELSNGLLTITLKKEIPEALKPKSIPIGDGMRALEHQRDETEDQAA